MKLLFVVVCLALILICDAEPGLKINCKKQKKCRKIEGLICGEMTYGVEERFCISFDPCAFFGAYCANQAVFGYFGGCRSAEGCTDGVQAGESSGTSKKKSWAKRLLFWKRKH